MREDSVWPQFLASIQYLYECAFLPRLLYLQQSVMVVFLYVDGAVRGGGARRERPILGAKGDRRTKTQQ